MNAVVAMVRANLLRLVHERSNLFFLVILPMLIVFALGTAIGGTASYRVGVVDGAPTEASTFVRDRMDDVARVEVVDYDDAAELRDAVARRSIDAGWIVDGPADASGASAAVVPGAVVPAYRWLAAPSSDGMDLRTAFDTAVADSTSLQQVTAGVAQTAGVGADEAAAAVAAAVEAIPGTEVTLVDAKAGEATRSSIRAVLAAGQLTLFIFLTSLTGAGYLLISRQLGVIRRMRAAPVPVSAIILGEGVTRFLIACGQAAIIFFGAMVLFGVDWRSPGAVLALCVAMALVGTGGAMLLGSLGRSEQQVSAISLAISLAMAALGGSMQPLEFFPDSVRTLAFVTPHAWMNDALWKILVDGAGFAEVWPSVAVLVAIGLALLVAATVALRRHLK